MMIEQSQPQTSVELKMQIYTYIYMYKIEYITHKPNYIMNYFQIISFFVLNV